ncbi:MAG TPA: sigma-70 family RNA polymerase sigma factor [Planctomycetota bacterium]
MPTDQLDRDFQTFRQSRDPAALASVFDAAAPRLLLVAMHLCRDAATAEDLVQTVFLQVLRDADRFDPRRPLMPWLLGMLEHRASDQRQRAHVRRERALDADAVPPLAADASPERAAAANEVRERVAEALRGMPRDYRDVLTLRLVHGLAAVDIAHAHGLPPATVRTRLRRGLELLRGALPRGIATRGLLALLAAELTFARDGMAAVRTKVLAAAAVGAGAGVSVAVGWWLAFAAALVLAAGGWLWLGPASAVAPQKTDEARVVASAVGKDAQRSHDFDAAPDLQRVAAPQPEREGPDVTTVRGRVVDASSGAPMPGVVAKMRTYPWETNDPMPGWSDPEPVRTAADGTFALRFVPLRDRGVEVGLVAEGYVEEYLSFEPLRCGVDVDAGDVRLQQGTPVRLHLSCNGQPIGGVQTWARYAPGGQQPANLGGYGVSDTNGIVDLGVCAPGPWWHDVQTAHLGAQARFEVPLQRIPLVVKVELLEPPRDRSISGVLVDTAGTSVAGVELGMRAPNGGYFTATTRTDGGFLWASAALLPASVRERIELLADRRKFEWVTDGGEITWGTHDLRLVVRRRAPATLRLEVFDGATQQPVEAFGATCKDGVGSGSGERRRTAVEHHSGGIATFEVAPGLWYASVFPEEPFAESAEIAVQLAEGRTTTLRVELRQAAALDVDVVDASSGAPLEGVELALAKAVPSQGARDVDASWYQMLREKPGMAGSSFKGTGVIVLARGVSDGEGRASLHAPADVPGLVLVAGGARCIPSEHHDVALPQGGARTTIRVTAAAIVRGTVTPLAFVERFGPAPERLAETAAKARTQWTDPEEFAGEYPSVVLRPLHGTSTEDLTAHVAADGTFTFRGVPSGRYAVHVDAHVWGSGTGLGPYATIDVDPARAPPPLAIDVAELVPGRGTVRFFVDGAPAHGEGALGRIVEDSLAYETFPLARDGTATTPWLLPGTYVPFVVTGDGARIFGSERLVVTTGTSVDATFTLQRRRVAIAIVDGAGEPAGDVIVLTDAIDRPEIGRCRWLPNRTDAGGHLLFAQAPPGRLRLRTFARDQDPRSRVEPAVLLGDVAADANAATFRLPR